MQNAWPHVERWLRHHSVFTVRAYEWKQFAEFQWPSHNAASFTSHLPDPSTRMSSSGRKHWLQSSCLTWMKSWSCLFVMLLPFYWFGIPTKALSDPVVYGQLLMNASQAEVFRRSTTARTLLRRYTCGITHLLVYRLLICFPRRRTLSNVPDPIISYKHVIHTKFFRVAAIAPHLIMPGNTSEQ